VAGGTTPLRRAWAGPGHRSIPLSGQQPRAARGRDLRATSAGTVERLRNGRGTAQGHAAQCPRSWAGGASAASAVRRGRGAVSGSLGRGSAGHDPRSSRRFRRVPRRQGDRPCRRPRPATRTVCPRRLRRCPPGPRRGVPPRRALPAPRSGVAGVNLTAGASRDDTCLDFRHDRCYMWLL